MNFQIDNFELNKILSFVKDEPIFFDENKRLLSKSEIIEYKNELNISKEDIIPLIDLCDNNFVIYDIKKNGFIIMDISDDFIRHIDSIKNYINLLSSDRKQ